MSSNPSHSTAARQLALATAALRGARRDLELAAAAGDDPVARLGHRARAVAGLWAAGAVLADLLADTGPAANPAGRRSGPGREYRPEPAAEPDYDPSARIPPRSRTRRR